MNLSHGQPAWKQGLAGLGFRARVTAMRSRLEVWLLEVLKAQVLHAMPLDRDVGDQRAAALLLASNQRTGSGSILTEVAETEHLAWGHDQSPADDRCWLLRQLEQDSSELSHVALAEPDLYSFSDGQAFVAS